MCKVHNNRESRWRLILKYYGPGIYYIKGKNNIVAYAISQRYNDGNQNTTHDPNYIMENMSEINNLKTNHYLTFVYFL